jgi:hypothetical protein
MDYTACDRRILKNGESDNAWKELREASKPRFILGTSRISDRSHDVSRATFGRKNNKINVPLRIRPSRKLLKD